MGAQQDRLGEILVGMGFIEADKRSETRCHVLPPLTTVSALKPQVAETAAPSDPRQRSHISSESPAAHVAASTDAPRTNPLRQFQHRAHHEYDEFG